MCNTGCAISPQLCHLLHHGGIFFELPRRQWWQKHHLFSFRGENMNKHRVALRSLSFHEVLWWFKVVEAFSFPVKYQTNTCRAALKTGLKTLTATHTYFVFASFFKATLFTQTLRQVTQNRTSNSGRCSCLWTGRNLEQDPAQSVFSGHV